MNEVDRWIADLAVRTRVLARRQALS